LEKAALLNKRKPRAFRGPRLVSLILEIQSGRPHKYDYYDEQSYNGLYLNSAAIEIFKKHNDFLIYLTAF